MRGLGAVLLLAQLPRPASSHGLVVIPSARQLAPCSKAYGPTTNVSSAKPPQVGDPQFYCMADREHGQDHPPAPEPGKSPLPSPVCTGGNINGVSALPGWDELYAALQHPGPVVATYASGSEIEVTWQVVNNHGGFYSYRLCTDGSDTEECFQRTPLQTKEGLHWLPKDGMNTSRCEGTPNTPGHGCRALQKRVVCPGDLAGGVGKGCHYTDRLLLPAGVSCERCTLSWRWDTGIGNRGGNEQTVFTNCADISITPAPPGPPGPSTPSPPTTPPPPHTPPPPSPPPAPPAAWAWKRKVCYESRCANCSPPTTFAAGGCGKFNGNVWAQGTCAAGSITVSLYSGAGCTGRAVETITKPTDRCEELDMIGYEEYTCNQQ